MTQKLLLPIVPSYNTGFAASREEALFPSLWDGVTFAGFFNMGPSQSVYDFSGRQPRQTSGGPTVFRYNTRGWALEHSNTSDSTTLGNMDDIVATRNVSVLIGKEKTDGTLRAGSVFGNSSSTTNRRCGFLGPWTDGEYYFDFGGSTSGSTRVDTGNDGAGPPAYADNDIACTTGSRGMEIWQDGIRIAHNSANPTRSTSSGDTFELGRHAAVVSDLLGYRYIVVYERQLTPDEIMLVAHYDKAMLMQKRNIYAVVGLATEHPRTEEDDISLSDQALGNGIYPRALSDTITFGQGITLTGDQSRFEEDDLGITDESDWSKDHGRSIEDDLGLTDNASLTSVIDDLGISDSVFAFNAINDREVPENVLGLTDEVISTLTPILEDPITFVQEVTVIGPIELEVFQQMGLQDGVHNCNGAPWEAIEIEDTLSFSHFPGIGFQITIEDVLSFTDSTKRVFGAHHILNITQDVDVGKATPEIEDTLSFTQIVETENELIRSISHTTILSQSFAYYIDSGCRRKQYNRFEGLGDSTGVPLPPLTYDASFVLESTVGTKSTVELRNPETDDIHRIGYSRINRESRGGELQVYSDPDWPQVETLLFTIVALPDGTKTNCPDKINSLLTFFQDTLGQEILLHDWEGITWKGVVTTPNEVATEDRDGWWTMTFEFQGTAQDGAQNDQNLAINQTVGLLHDHNRSISDDLGITDTGRPSIINESISDDLGMSDTLAGTVETVILEDDTDGVLGNGINGTTPDVGSSTWNAHANYRANGAMSAGINSGCYYNFIPTDGYTYDIQWNVRSLSPSEGLESLFFLGESYNVDANDVGAGAFGRTDPTTLKAGFLLWLQGGSQQNSCRLGDISDGQADTVVFSDATLKAEGTEIDLRLVLDTTGGAGSWKATWYAKDILDSVWTEVRSETSLISEDIGVVGWSNDNTTTTYEIDNINVTQIKAV